MRVMSPAAPSPMSSADPPFNSHYGPLLSELLTSSPVNRASLHEAPVEPEEIPLIDLSDLRSESPTRRRDCTSAMARAAAEWGFFQVVNHGISQELLLEMRREQRRVFGLTFEKKSRCGLFGNGSYRWGTPTATSLRQLSWSEAFHVPLSTFLEEKDYSDPEFNPLREVMKRLATAMSELGCSIATALANNLQGCSGGVLAEGFSSEKHCFLRLNRYPPCRFSPAIYGLAPHTDSDFLTILYQDEVGGLQVMKDSRWVAVKPNPSALFVNIGDLFQAWSNDAYKSVEHKVMTNGPVERYSVAYLLCPSHDSVLGSCAEPSAYRKFTFGEYRRQVQEDVNKTGQKVGLPRFRL